MFSRAGRLALVIGMLLVHAPAGQSQFRLPAGARLRLGSGSNPLLSVAYSPDGSLLAVAGYDNVIELWDPAMGKQIRRWETPEGSVASLVFSPDGHLLASGGLYDSVVHLWDVASGRTVRDLEGLPNGVSSLAFAPDGKLMAAGGYGTDGIYFWETATGKALAPSVGPYVPPTNADGERVPFVEYSYVAFAPNGKTLASGHLHGLVRIWDTTTRREERHFRGPESDVFVHLAYSADSQIVAGWGESIRLWKADSGKQPLFTNWGESMGFWKTDPVKPIKAFGEQPTMRIASAAWAPDLRTIASSSSGPLSADDSVHIWETATGTERCHLDGHLYAISSVAFSPDGKTLASVSRDGTAILWDLKSLPVEALEKNFGSREELEAYWREMGHGDASFAYRAIRGMIAVPQQAAPFLQARLSPLTRAQPEQVRGWINALDDRIFKTREDAAQSLAEQFELAEPLMRELLTKQLSTEAHRRLQQILQIAAGGGMIAHQLQVLRALEILEGIGTTESKQVIEKMARGDSGFKITRDAKAALARLNRTVVNR